VSVVKSVSVGYGDMFYILHNSDNFTMIDCMLPRKDDAWAKRVVDELVEQSKGKGIVRFISTHPDQDHVHGLEYLDSRMKLLNFYCVKNAVIKKDPTSDFKHYCSLRDDSKKAFYIYKGCSRRWMNLSSDERGPAGIDILWPDTKNGDYQAVLEAAERGEKANNTSAIIEYSLNNGITALWMGDLETDFMEKIDGHVDLPKKVDLLFAPHHGRKTGRVPDRWLKEMKPTVIVLGEAESEYLHYYPGWDTITQNSAGDITFDCMSGRVDVYISSKTYSVDFLYDAGASANLGRYIGSFNV
jgi:beta-lactamase superfamily II metal-dependent hydrolase